MFYNMKTSADNVVTCITTYLKQYISNQWLVSNFETLTYL